MKTISSQVSPVHVPRVPRVPRVPHVPRVRFANLFDGPRLDCTSRGADTVVNRRVICVQYITERHDLFGMDWSPCHWVFRRAPDPKDPVRRRAAEDVP